MALDAGCLKCTIQFAKDIKDCDWFGRQDPYVIVRCAGQSYRTRTHVDGGRNPVWNETFSFSIINDNTLELTLMDADTLSKDDIIGRCTVSLARVRCNGTDTVQLPVMSKKNKQHGFLQVTLVFEPNNALKAPASAHYSQQHSFAHSAYPSYPYAPSFPAPAPQPSFAYPAPAYPAPAYQPAAPPLQYAAPQYQPQQPYPAPYANVPPQPGCSWAQYALNTTYAAPSAPPAPVAPPATTPPTPSYYPAAPQHYPVMPLATGYA